MPNITVDQYHNERNAQSESPSGIVPVGANVNWHGAYVLRESEQATASFGGVAAETVSVAAAVADSGERIPRRQQAERNMAEPVPDMFADVEDVHFVTLFEPETPIESE